MKAKFQHSDSVVQVPPRAHILMCHPKHFAVDYAINPWMDPFKWNQDRSALTSAAHKQWASLNRTLKNIGAEIKLLPAAPNLPDLVFTANAAVILDGKVILAKFKHPERQPEEIHFTKLFNRLKNLSLVDEIVTLPENLFLEGAGDCVWDQTRKIFWMGYGPRSTRNAKYFVKDYYGFEVVDLNLINPHYYHMDTAISPLSKGELMFVPEAFSDEGKHEIYDRVGPDSIIELTPEDSANFTANAVCVDEHVILSNCSDQLKNQLEERGYIVHRTHLETFSLSGGSAFCLTLRLDRKSINENIAISLVA